MSFKPQAGARLRRMPTGWQKAAPHLPGDLRGGDQRRIHGGAGSTQAGIGPGTAMLDLCCGSWTDRRRGGGARRGRDRARFLAGNAGRGARGASRPALRGCSDAGAMPFAAASFDAVVSNFGVHHVPYARSVLWPRWRATCCGRAVGSPSPTRPRRRRKYRPGGCCSTRSGCTAIPMRRQRRPGVGGLGNEDAGTAP